MSLVGMQIGDKKGKQRDCMFMSYSHSEKFEKIKFCFNKLRETFPATQKRIRKKWSS